MFELAFTLHMSAYTLMNTMTYEEFAKWMLYFEQRPIGWREDDRTAKLLAAQGVKAKPVDLFPSLKVMYGAKSEAIEDGRIVSLSSFKGSGFYQKILAAKGGEHIT